LATSGAITALARAPVLKSTSALTEPVPSRESRRAILAYEATEGGAGVLGRLTTEPQALARVARTALDLMHYRNLVRHEQPLNS
jgi:hypothetical protein